MVSASHGCREGQWPRTMPASTLLCAGLAIAAPAVTTVNGVIAVLVLVVFALRLDPHLLEQGCVALQFNRPDARDDGTWAFVLAQPFSVSSFSKSSYLPEPLFLRL